MVHNLSELVAILDNPKSTETRDMIVDEALTAIQKDLNPNALGLREQASLWYKSKTVWKFLFGHIVNEETGEIKYQTENEELRNRLQVVSMYAATCMAVVYGAMDKTTGFRLFSDYHKNQETCYNFIRRQWNELGVNTVIEEEELAQKLAETNPLLPVVVATSLYYYGKSRFHERDREQYAAEQRACGLLAYYLFQNFRQRNNCPPVILETYCQTSLLAFLAINTAKANLEKSENTEQSIQALETTKAMYEEVQEVDFTNIPYLIDLNTCAQAVQEKTKRCSVILPPSVSGDLKGVCARQIRYINSLLQRSQVVGHYTQQVVDEKGKGPANGRSGGK